MNKESTKERLFLFQGVSLKITFLRNLKSFPKIPTRIRDLSTEKICYTAEKGYRYTTRNG